MQQADPIGSRRKLLEQSEPPASGLGAGDGEFEGVLALGAAEDRRAGKQPPAQGGQLRALGLTELALEADARSRDGVSLLRVAVVVVVRGSRA
jgi:hypothetical protein